jgi:hypothetical protein
MYLPAQRGIRLRHGAAGFGGDETDLVASFEATHERPAYEQIDKIKPDQAAAIRRNRRN